MPRTVEPARRALAGRAVREPEAETPAEAMRFLREEIQRQGLSAQALAAQLGIRTPSYLSHLLSGRLVLADSRYFAPLCEALRLSPERCHHLQRALHRARPQRVFRRPHARR